MNQQLKIGMIGLDTSHCGLFTNLLNSPEHQFHVPGGKVTLAYPGGSEDLHSSISRVAGYTEEMRSKYGVAITDSIEEVADRTDAIFLTSVDGRTHLEQFERIARFGKPVYINKPFALSTHEAQAILELADKHGATVMSCSSLRYADPLVSSLQSDERGPVIGADAFSLMPLEPTNPGWYWYGIHAVEMLYTAMSAGCQAVRAYGQGDSEIAVGMWEGGKVGTVRGNRANNHEYGITVHRDKGSIAVSPLAGERPFYAQFVQEVVKMFQSGVSPISAKEMLEIIRFMEAANESRETGKEVML